MRFASLQVVSAAALTVHLVQHSHDDVGWLKTVDQYYRGLKDTIQQACVKCTIDSVLQSLARNPNRTFSFTEVKWLSLWADEASAEDLATFRRLHQAGQLELPSTAAGACTT